MTGALWTADALWSAGALCVAAALWRSGALWASGATGATEASWANAGAPTLAAIRDPATTAAAFRDFIVFLSAATQVAGGDSVAVPNEP
ncbi:hypothetical protein [Streptomyces sp. NPDC001843]|uniref:hypothetical protein n=1 Tax=Streptomyces sp. NPDC001843 TaxID=3364617 RepID=UPI0036C39434